MSKPAIITIGNFDGVHLGHQAILATARRMAQPNDAGVIALTFDPFPVAILRPDQAPPRLTSIDQRVAALTQAGADEVVVIEPTREILSQEAARFIAGLVEQHHAVGFVEGKDFRFGNKRGGNMTMLAEMGRERGFGVEAMPRVEQRLRDQSVAPISSSLVRWLIGRGRVEDAQACLGRPFELAGRIVKGEQRGRTIGVPTINLDPAAYTGQIVPMDGVYAGSAILDSQPATEHSAAISVGLKPTFGHNQLTVEAHLLNLNTEHPDSLYGQHVRLRFARWLRDQYPFPGVEMLKQQLRRDIAAAAQPTD